MGSNDQINLVSCRYVVDLGMYQFPDKLSFDKFIKKPKFSFDFQPSNVEDKKGMKRIFGEKGPVAKYPNNNAEFIVTHLEKSEDDENVAIVSVEIPLEFEILVAKKEFIKWVENDDTAWRYSGRIVCDGEDGLLQSDREEYEFD